MHDSHSPLADLRSFRRRLVAWYDRAGRQLPWRQTADPYRIWISEIMLQQTTVAAVVPYFERFLTRFPSVEALAAADEQDVLRLWEGLGYYSRARNLRRAAIALVTDHAGQFPADPDELAALPGIGRYTAGAIASFAFDKPAPIVEANTARLYARLIGLDESVKSTAGQRQLWEFAAAILPRRRSGRFNQALMELGSQICTPKDPDCDRCPVAVHCVARQTGRQHELPRLQPRVELTDVVDAYVAVAHEGRYLLRQRTESERWAGLWDFPRYTLAEGDAAYTATSADIARLADQIRGDFHLAVNIGDVFKEIRHGVTRYRIRVNCFAARPVSEPARPDFRDDVRWVTPTEMAHLGLSTPARTLATALQHMLPLAWDDGAK